MGNTTDVKKEDLKPEAVAVTETVAVQAGSEVKADLSRGAAQKELNAQEDALVKAAAGVPVTFEQFLAVDIRVGEVKTAETVPKADKLLKLTVDFGALGTRTVMAGIAKSFPDPQALVGKRLGFVCNLPPRPMFGVESQAMLLAATDSTAPEKVVLMECPGAQVGARLG